MLQFVKSLIAWAARWPGTVCREERRIALHGRVLESELLISYYGGTSEDAMLACSGDWDFNE